MSNNNLSSNGLDSAECAPNTIYPGWNAANEPEMDFSFDDFSEDIATNALYEQHRELGNLAEPFLFDVNIRDYDVILKERGRTKTTRGAETYKDTVRPAFTRERGQDVHEVLSRQHLAYNEKFEGIYPAPTFFVRRKKAVDHDQKYPDEKPFLDFENETDNYSFDRKGFYGVRYIRANRHCILHDLETGGGRKTPRKTPRKTKPPRPTLPTQPRFNLKDPSMIDDDALLVIDKWLLSTESSRSETTLKRDLIDQFWKDVAAYRVLFGDPLEAEANDDYDRYRQSRHEKNLLDSVNAFGNAMLDWHLSDSRSSEMSSAGLPPPLGGLGEGNNEYDFGNSNQGRTAREGGSGGPPSDSNLFPGGSGGSDLQQENGDHFSSDSDSTRETDSDEDIDLHGGSSVRTSRTNSLTLGSSMSGSLASAASSHNSEIPPSNLDDTTSSPSTSSGKSCDKKVNSVEAQNDIQAATNGLVNVASIEAQHAIPGAIHSVERATSVDIAAAVHDIGNTTSFEAPSDISAAVHHLENVHLENVHLENLSGCNYPKRDAVHKGVSTAEVNLPAAPKKSNKWKMPAMLGRHLRGKQEKKTKRSNSDVEMQPGESPHPSSVMLTDPIKSPLQVEDKCKDECVQKDIILNPASQLSLQENEDNAQNQQQLQTSKCKASLKIEDVSHGDPMSASIPSTSQELELIVQLQATMLHEAKIESKSTPKASLASLGPESSGEGPDRKARMLKSQEKTRSDFYATSLQDRQESSDNEDEELRKALAASLYFD